MAADPNTHMRGMPVSVVVGNTTREPRTAGTWCEVTYTNIQQREHNVMEHAIQAMPLMRRVCGQRHLPL